MLPYLLLPRLTPPPTADTTFTATSSTVAKYEEIVGLPTSRDAIVIVAAAIVVRALMNNRFHTGKTTTIYFHILFTPFFFPALFLLVLEIMV
jgi:hypothetical protein